MSTRGTITLKSQHGSDVHLYKHHDSYPEGFIQDIIRPMLDKWSPASQSLHDFLLENTECEDTSHYNQHGDTEYHYDVYVGGAEIAIVMADIKWSYGKGDTEKRHFTKFYKGSIEKLLKTEWAN